MGLRCLFWTRPLVFRISTLVCDVYFRPDLSSSGSQRWSAMSISGPSSRLRDLNIGLRCLFQARPLVFGISTFVCDVCSEPGLSSLGSQRWSVMSISGPVSRLQDHKHGSAMSVLGLASRLGTVKVGLPTEDDYRGSLSSLIRLQRVYRLSVHHMYAGNYSGYEGPALQLEDTFLLGRQAFMDGYLQECIEWLELAVELMRTNGTTSSSSSTPAVTPFSLAQAASLLGRASFFVSSLSCVVPRHTPKTESRGRQVVTGSSTWSLPCGKKGWEQHSQGNLVKCRVTPCSPIFNMAEEFGAKRCPQHIVVLLLGGIINLLPRCFTK